MSKKEFADKLVALEPKIKLTSETSSEYTILDYLMAKER
jgi:hypothetical protein